MKAIITSGLLLGAAYGLMAPAIAGPYVNVESEAGFSGSDYVGSYVHSHLGYEQKVGTNTKVYGQIGPTVVFQDNQALSTRLGAKVGGKVVITPKADLYGEFKMVTGDASKYAVKGGVTYRF